MSNLRSEASVGADASNRRRLVPDTTNVAPRGTFAGEHPSLCRIGSGSNLEGPRIFDLSAQPLSTTSSSSPGPQSPGGGSVLSFPMLTKPVKKRVQRQGSFRSFLQPALSDSTLEKSSRLAASEAGKGLLTLTRQRSAPPNQSRGLLKDETPRREGGRGQWSRRQRGDDEALKYYLSLLRESGMKTTAGAVHFADSKIAAEWHSWPTGRNVNSTAQRPSPPIRRVNSRLDMLALFELDVQEESDNSDECDCGHGDGHELRDKTQVAKAASLINVPMPTLMEIWRGIRSGGDRDTCGKGTASEDYKKCTDHKERPDHAEPMELLETWGNASRESSLHDSLGEDSINGEWDGADLLEGWGNHKPFCDTNAKEDDNKDNVRSSQRYATSRSQSELVATKEKTDHFMAYRSNPGFAHPA
eukprot:CAMPEP_0197458554 /NCGR_PEP_ID=MMETSP1175-20131217/49004_1 /TAXON_ID=1003142 /ORGANISM="Triceratium dubium, Strain CCMP147" /LENGTH=414 /DNA_ID=CAMNT_0042993221 /DNA_START=181 /DNA_END=1425 /DNA_ORIENTATION=+